ncbi:MAG: ribose-phosphate pyrophosphokinase, partial [bacterium]
MKTSEAKDTQAKPVLKTSPDGRLAIIPLKSTEAVGAKINDYLVKWRKDRVKEGLVPNDNGYSRSSFLIEATTPRFGSGEGKGTIKESVRGDDLYVLVDVCNHSLTYRLAAYENIMSPDDHFQD